MSRIARDRRLRQRQRDREVFGEGPEGKEARDAERRLRATLPGYFDYSPSHRRVRASDFVSLSFTPRIVMDALPPADFASLEYWALVHTLRRGR